MKDVTIDGKIAFLMERSNQHEIDIEKKLIETLEKSNKRCHENFDRAKGVRGSTNSSSCNFYMGAYAILENAIDAIKTRKTSKLKSWGK